MQSKCLQRQFVYKLQNRIKPFEQLTDFRRKERLHSDAASEVYEIETRRYGNGHNNEISNLMLFPNHSEHLKYERPKDMSNRECGICGSKETYKRPDGHFVWFIKDNRYMCQKCRDRIRYDLKRKNIWRKKQ